MRVVDREPDEEADGWLDEEKKPLGREKRIGSINGGRSGPAGSASGLVPDSDASILLNYIYWFFWFLFLSYLFLDTFTFCMRFLSFKIFPYVNSTFHCSITFQATTTLRKSEAEGVFNNRFSPNERVYCILIVRYSIGYIVATRSEPHSHTVYHQTARYSSNAMHLPLLIMTRVWFYYNPPACPCGR